MRIINNLRSIEDAVQQWALEQTRTGAVEVTWMNIGPYLGHSPVSEGRVKAVAGEIYTLKSLVESPEAQLTRDLEGRPKGTVIRLGTNDAEFILPKLPSQNPQRDSGMKPRVANRELPWVKCPQKSQPQRGCGQCLFCGTLTPLNGSSRNPVGVDGFFRLLTRGRCSRATLGFRSQSLWDSQTGCLTPPQLPPFGLSPVWR